MFHFDVKNLWYYYLSFPILLTQIFFLKNPFWLYTTWRLYLNIWKLYTAWNLSKSGVFSGPYFPAFGLNAETYSVSFSIQSEEETLCLDIFHSVILVLSINFIISKLICKFNVPSRNKWNTIQTKWYSGELLIHQNTNSLELSAITDFHQGNCKKTWQDWLTST